MKKRVNALTSLVDGTSMCPPVSAEGFVWYNTLILPANNY